MHRWSWFSRKELEVLEHELTHEDGCRYEPSPSLEHELYVMVLEIRLVLAKRRRGG